MEIDAAAVKPECRQTISCRSLSLNSVSSDGSSEPPRRVSQQQQVGHEDILALTQDVKAFKDALGNLRRIFHPQKDKQEEIRSSAHEKLGNVLRILRGILEKYAALQSTELLMAAGQLIQQVKGFNFEDEKSDPTDFLEAIEQLALSFCSRVSEYLMGDLDTSSSVHPAARSKSCEALPDADFAKYPDVLSAEQIDEALMRVEQEQGVNVALQRAKVWAKYTKDIVAYVEKRCALELEHCRSVAKLAHATKSVLKEESYLPFQSIYCLALEQDGDNANLMQATCSLLQGHKFVEPLIARRNEHEKVRKQLKETWQREMKKMQDAVNNLRKARTVYIQRQLDHEKAKDSVQRAELSEASDAGRIEKKKKWEEEAMQKAAEADTTYKACVIEANEKHQNMQKLKAEVLKQVRELILQCDQTMKAATVSYFQLLHTVVAPSPVQCQMLCENSRLYEPGAQYAEFVKRLQIPSDVPVFEPPPFAFEPYVPTDSRLHDRRSNSGHDGSEESLTPSSGASEQGKSAARKAWCPVSDSDSVGSNQSNKSLDTSPYGSPRIPVRRLDSIDDELIEADDDAAEGQSRGFSKAAVTHTFRKLRTSARCRECDTYVYFQGLDCIECGLACHKKCVATLALQCGHKRMKPKLTTFGVDLSVHLSETNRDVPLLVTRCIDEIEQRGMEIKGIYRVSGVKSKVEKLCQSFENGVELVDLSDVHPNVIANVLKLYLRQLPEPLLTYNMYPNLIQLAQKHVNREADDTSAEITDSLAAILTQLAAAHLACLTAVIRHLKRVSLLADTNNMPARNLSIVFGPTLLRTTEGSASLSSLVDTVYQTRTVELLIVNADRLFGTDGPRDDDDDDDGGAPMPPPRRHPSHRGINRGSPEQCNGDRIVIHVQGDRAQPVAAPRTLVPSDVAKDDVPYVDESPPEPAFVDRPVPSPRYILPIPVTVTPSSEETSPVPPSTTSSMDELDVLGMSSPTLGRHSRCASADVEMKLTAGELGSRNSLLRAATRYQRHSPAYSTASTKSSDYSSSPLPDDAAVVVKARASHSLSPPLHRVGDDAAKQRFV